jgi:hypothetical protein
MAVEATKKMKTGHESARDEPPEPEPEQPKKPFLPGLVGLVRRDLVSAALARPAFFRNCWAFSTS